MLTSNSTALKVVNIQTVYHHVINPTSGPRLRCSQIGQPVHIKRYCCISLSLSVHISYYCYITLPLHTNHPCFINHQFVISITSVYLNHQFVISTTSVLSQPLLCYLNHQCLFSYHVLHQAVISAAINLITTIFIYQLSRSA